MQNSLTYCEFTHLARFYRLPQITDFHLERISCNQQIQQIVNFNRLFSLRLAKHSRLSPKSLDTWTPGNRFSERA